jgi:predicted dehydrogenase
MASRPALIREAIDLGVAVVSDKPFAADAAQAKALVEFAEHKGVMLSVYQNRRWDSDFLTVRRLIDGGVLGEISRFESRVERFSPKSVGKAAGGGMLRDLGSHLVDQALVLFGPVVRVYSELEFSEPGQPFDHQFFVSLTHANGVISHLWGSCLQNVPGPRFRVSGAKGCYTVEGLDCQEEAALAGLTPKSEGARWGVEDQQRWGWVVQGEQREQVPTERGCWPEFYRQLLVALAGDGLNPVNPHDAVASARVLDAARLSALEGRVVAL